MTKILTASVLVLLLSSATYATPTVVGDVVLNSDGTYTYTYELSDVDPGRKVTGIAWWVTPGPPSVGPESGPLVYTVPWFWTFGIGSGTLGGAWISSVGARFIHPETMIELVTPIGPNSGTLLHGDTRVFSFTTGYAPVLGTYQLSENENGSEVNYQQLFGTVVLPNVDGSLNEQGAQGTGLNLPPDFVPPVSVPDDGDGLGMLAMSLMAVACAHCFTGPGR